MMLMLGCTVGTNCVVAAVISASRGSRRGLSPSSTTTVISMGSSCAKPAARGPVMTDPGRSGAVELAMRASWGEVKWLDVRPVVVPWLPDVGTVVVYLFRERVTDAAQPLGDWVVVVDDEADPPALTEVTDEPDVQPLTPRELEVLRLMALGWETEYIAAELEVTLHTVRSPRSETWRRKLNAKSRFEAVMTATRLGILSLGDR